MNPWDLDATGLLIWGIVAHLIADWPLQNDWMARHKANHAQLVYAPDAETADRALVAKAAMLQGMGIRVNVVGDVTI